MKNVVLLIVSVLLAGCATGGYHRTSDSNGCSNAPFVRCDGDSNDGYVYPGYVGASYNDHVVDENNNEFVRRSSVTYPDPNPRKCSDAPFVRCEK